MSKRRKQYKNKVYTVVPNVEIELSTGAVVRCLPVLATIEAIRQTVELPEKPTYELKGVGGDVTLIPYDDEAAHDPATPKVDLIKWLSYKAQLAAASTEASARIFKRIIRRGIKVVKGGMDSGGISKTDFIKELKEDEIEVPKNKAAFKRLYIRLEVIATPDDLTAIMTGIGIASGADEERIKEAEAKLFRAVEEGQEPSTDDDTGAGDSSERQAATG